MAASQEYLIRIALEIQNDKQLRLLTDNMNKAAVASGKINKPIKQAAKDTRAFGRTAANAGYQVQDFIVQVQGGVDPIRAMSQQLPQLFIGFGALGAALGVVAAIVPSVIQLFKDTDEELKDLSEETEKAAAEAEKLATEFDQLQTAISDLSLDSLVEEFQKATAAQEEFILGTYEFKKAIANFEIDEALGAFQIPLNVGFESGAAAFDIYRKRMDEFAKSIGLAAGEMRVLEGSFREAVSPITRNSENIGELVIELQKLFVAGGSRNAQLEQTIDLLIKAQQATKALEEADASLLSGVKPESKPVAGGGGGKSSDRVQQITAEERQIKSMIAEYDKYLQALAKTAEAYTMLYDPLAAYEAELAKIAEVQDQMSPEVTAAAVENAAKKYADAIKEFSFAEEAITIFDKSFNTMLDGVLMGTQSIAEGFEDMAKVVIAQLLKIAAQYAIIQAFGGASGGGFGQTFAKAVGFGAANGAAFGGGKVLPFAKGGIVNSPTLFPMANGMGLMGEAGPEAVMPLKRGANGKLGVESSGMNVTVNNLAPGVAVETRQGENGLTIDVVMKQVTNAIQRGGTDISNALEGSYALSRGKAVY